MVTPAPAMTRDEIARLIPHQGAMVLLDGVFAWDEISIRCWSTRHRAPDNPLRQQDRLGALCAIEFAAQAMALHGGLAGNVGAGPRAGYIASLREIACRCDRLDDIAGDLEIEAKQLMGEAAQVVYSFAVRGAGRDLVAGRATVILDAGNL
jgi:predicted hotdog family 3-hydroxylacyl-ACP dehydratase